MNEFENKLPERPDYDAFYKNLRSLMDSKGILGKDLALEINSTPATISRYVTGAREPELEYVFRLCQYFGVSIDWMFGLSDDKQSVYTPEIRKILELYSRASAEDQAVIKTVLRKYEY